MRMQRSLFTGKWHRRNGFALVTEKLHKMLCLPTPTFSIKDSTTLCTFFRPQKIRFRNWHARPEFNLCNKRAALDRAKQPNSFSFKRLPITNSKLIGVLQLYQQMTSYYAMQEPQHVEDYAALFCSREDVRGIYEDCPPLLESIFESCQSANSDYLLQEDDFFHDSICPPYEEAVYSTNSIYEEEHHFPYNSWKYWCSDYDSPSVAFTSCWDNDSFCHGNDNNVNWHAGDFEKTDQPVLQSEVQGDGYSCNFGSATTEPSSEDRPWSGYESWFRCPTEEDSHHNGNPDQKYRDSYSLDGIELFQGIIGYWPCIMGRHQGVIYAE